MVLALIIGIISDKHHYHWLRGGNAMECWISTAANTTENVSVAN